MFKDDAMEIPLISKGLRAPFSPERYDWMVRCPENPVSNALKVKPT